jgi:hypothetical protein
MPYSSSSKLRQDHVRLPFAISREPMMWSQPARPVLPRARSVRDCQQVTAAGPTARESALSKSSIVEALFLVSDHLSFCFPLSELYII